MFPLALSSGAGILAYSRASEFCRTNRLQDLKLAKIAGSLAIWPESDKNDFQDWDVMGRGEPR